MIVTVNPNMVFHDVGDFELHLNTHSPMNWPQFIYFTDPNGKNPALMGVSLESNNAEISIVFTDIQARELEDYV